MQESLVTVTEKVSRVIGKGEWNADIEKALQDIATPSFAVVQSVLNLDIDEETALRFFCWAGKQDGYEHDREIVNQVACIWAAKYGEEKLSCLLRRIIAKGSKFDEAVWAVMIVANTLLQKPEDALTVFMEMKKTGRKLTALSYEPLLFVLVKNNRCDAALLTAQEMLNSGIFPEHKALGALLEGLCKTGKSEAALKFVQEMGKLEHVGYFEFAYSRLITAVWRTGRPSMALELLSEMKNKGLTPDRHAYTVCIKHLCKSLKFDAARKLLNAMYEQNCAPDVMTYNALINGLSKAGKPEEGLSILKLMEEKGCPFDSKIYTATLKCLFAAGRTDDALQTFDQMSKAGHAPDMLTYYVMVKNLCNIGKVDAALDFKKVMIENGFQPDSKLYLALARGLCITGRMEEVFKLVSEMKGKGYAPNAEIYNSVVNHLCVNGDFEEARIWVKDMMNKGYKPTPYISTKFSTSLGDALLRW